MSFLIVVATFHVIVHSSLSVLHDVEQLDDILGWFGPVEGFPRSVVEFAGNDVEVVLTVCGRVGAFRETLVRQGPLVFSLVLCCQRLYRLQKWILHARSRGNLAMQRQLGLLVTGQQVGQ